jgi:hypothetical protein
VHIEKSLYWYFLEAAYVLFYVRKDVEWPAFVETVAEKKESEKTNEDGGCDDNDEYEEDDELDLGIFSLLIMQLILKESNYH